MKKITLLLFFSLFFCKSIYSQDSNDFPYGIWHTVNKTEKTLALWEDPNNNKKEKALNLMHQIARNFIKGVNIDKDFSGKLNDFNSDINEEDEIEITKDYRFKKEGDTYYTTHSDGENDFTIFLIKKIDNNNIYIKSINYSYTEMGGLFNPKNGNIVPVTQVTSIDGKGTRIQKSTKSGNKTDNNDDNTWTVIIGALTAVVVAGIIRRRKKIKAKKNKNPTKEKRKKEPTDYILQLNNNSFNLKLNEPKNLVVKVWKVTEKGKHLVNASIRITTPDKALKIIPNSNTGTLNSQLNLKDKPSNNQFNIKVTATAEGHTFQKAVKINFGEGKQLLIKTSPDNTRSLRPNLDILITCYAKIVDENGKVLSKETEKIKFKPQSNWIDLSDPVIDGEWIAINMGASDPNAIAAVSHPPQSVTLSVILDDVKEDEEILQNDLEIELLDCKIDTNIDSISLPVSDEQTEVTFISYIEDCDGSTPWQFEALYLTDDDKPDKPLSTIDLKQLSDSKVQITVTGPILFPPEGEKYLMKKLVIKTWQKEEKPLERHLNVIVSKEGLYVEKGAAKNDTIKFTAKGDYVHELEFGLYVYDEETNDTIVDKLGLQNLDFELIEKEAALKNINSVLKPELNFDDYVTTVPLARYILEVPNKFPGFGDYYNLHYRVKVLDAKYAKSLEFEKIITLRVQDYGIGEGFPDWQKAYDECKYTIIEYVPDSDKRHQLLDMLEKHKYKFDIEGMVAFRKMIWRTARDLMLNKRDGYLALANWYDAVIDTLEWVVWMGDIAFQVVVATYTGAVGGLAASAFKETFLTGVRLTIEGKSVDDFVDEEIETLKQMMYSVAKGSAINTRNIEKVYKGNKLKVWAIYAVVTFSMQYHRSGSIPQAAKDTARQLRDEAIISFLHGRVMEESARLKEKAIKDKEEKIREKQKDSTKPTENGTNDYESASHPPDVSGYTSGSLKAIQRIVNKFKVKIITRPTNAAARKLLKSGQAVAKKMFVKNKTINELDTYLGASKENIGKVGSFKPKLNRAKMKNLSKKQVKEVVKRYKQRRREYVNQAEHLIQNSDKLYVKKGVVYDRLTGKPFTGDIDIFDIRGPHGEKLGKAEYEKIVKELIKSKVTNIEHGAHLWWEYMKGGSAKDIKTNKGIYKKIAEGHSKGGEPLVEFQSGTSGGVKLKSVYYKG